MNSSLRLLLSQARDNLDPVRLLLRLIRHLKGDILNNERPDFVAESICVQPSLVHMFSLYVLHSLHWNEVAPLP